MCKSLFELLFLFIVQPDKAWKIVKEKHAKQEILNHYIFPVIGIAVCLSIITHALTNSPIVLMDCIKVAFVLGISLFSALYLAALGIKMILERISQKSINFNNCLAFVAYASSCVIMVNTFSQLTNAIFFFQLFSLYTIYIVWEGSAIYLQVKEKKRPIFTALTSAVIIGSPWLCRHIILFIMPGLQ